MRVSHPIELVLAERGSTKRWLAGRLGVHDTALNRMLAGQRALPANFYARASGILGVPESMLIPQEASAPIAQPITTLDAIGKAATNAESVAA